MSYDSEVHVSTCSWSEMHMMNPNSCFVHGWLELLVAVPGEVAFACDTM